MQMNTVITARWSVWDSRKTGAEVLRFDALAQLLAKGGLKEFDLVCSPHSTVFKPARDISQLRYVLLQRRNRFFKQGECIPIFHDRVFEDRDDRLPAAYRDSRDCFLKKLETSLPLCLEKDEPVLRAVLVGEGAPVVWSGFWRKARCRMLAFTDRKLFEFQLNTEQRYLEHVCTFPYASLKLFDLKKQIMTWELSVQMLDGVRFHWLQLPNREAQVISVILHGFTSATATP
jgi:hypothetical protein